MSDYSESKQEYDAIVANERQRQADLAADLRAHGFDTELPETALERQWAEKRSRQQAAAELARDTVRRQHSRLIAAADPGMRLILELHAPVFEYSLDPYCDGCDLNGCEAYEPTFPCRTYVLAERIITGRPE